MTMGARGVAQGNMHIASHRTAARRRQLRLLRQTTIDLI